MRVFSIRVSIDSKATDNDLIKTLKDYLNMDACHSTLKDVDFKVNNLEIKLVS